MDDALDERSHHRYIVGVDALDRDLDRVLVHEDRDRSAKNVSDAIPDRQEALGHRWPPNAFVRALRRVPHGLLVQDRRVEPERRQGAREPLALRFQSSSRGDSQRQPWSPAGSTVMTLRPSPNQSRSASSLSHPHGAGNVVSDPALIVVCGEVEAP